MPDDRTINGPGADAKPPAKPRRIASSKAAMTNAMTRAMVAPAIIIEETVQAAAARLGLTHERIVRGLIECAEDPYAKTGERVSAWRELAEIMGTKKAPPSQHVHLHASLERVPEDTLQARLSRLLSGAG